MTVEDYASSIQECLLDLCKLGVKVEDVDVLKDENLLVYKITVPQSSYLITKDGNKYKAEDIAQDAKSIIYHHINPEEDTNDKIDVKVLYRVSDVEWTKEKEDQISVIADDYIADNFKNNF